MKRLSVRCQIDGEVFVTSEGLVIDDGARLWRFTCPRCFRVQEKFLDEANREVLRSAGVLTVDEVVGAGAAALEDEQSFWAGLLQN